MALFDQAVRLLRTKWRTPTVLAEELYAMFTSKDAATQNAPLPIDNAGSGPYFDLKNYTPGNSLFQITGKGGAPVGDILLQDGNLVFQPAGAWPGAAEPAPSGTVKYPPGTNQPILGASSNVFAGQILSGSGASYQVALYPSGPNAPALADSVACQQLQIDTGATIPAGTWAMVWQGKDGGYYMQVPVILQTGP